MRKKFNSQFSIEFICNLADRFLVPLKKNYPLFYLLFAFFLEGIFKPLAFYWLSDAAYLLHWPLRTALLNKTAGYQNAKRL